MLDPHGPIEILNSGAASSFFAALGLLRAPRFFPRAPEHTVNSAARITRSVPWIAVTTVIAILYIVVLGRGIRFAF
jgi:multisubunit Na+/H+ antiporter MnhG subunit